MSLSIINAAGFDAQLFRKRIKNINIRIDRQGNVSVSAPMACPLNYIEQFLQKKQNWIIFHQTKLRQKLVSDSPLSPPNEQQRQEMRALLPTLIQKWEVIIGVRVNEWHIRAMKTRWGTCHPLKKRICLNLHLMQKPLICLEYVIVHELVHLLEASHNQRFYALMTQFMPEWKEYKRLLS